MGAISVNADVTLADVGAISANVAAIHAYVGVTITTVAAMITIITAAVMIIITAAVATTITAVVAITITAVVAITITAAVAITITAAVATTITVAATITAAVAITITAVAATTTAAVTTIITAVAATIITAAVNATAKNVIPVAAAMPPTSRDSVMVTVLATARVTMQAITQEPPSVLLLPPPFRSLSLAVNVLLNAHAINLIKAAFCGLIIQNYLSFRPGASKLSILTACPQWPRAHAPLIH